MATLVTPKLPPPCHGKLITILSIDGGGVRGIIPSVILGFLEGELQRIDGEEVRIADYFDVVAGTSTGGLVTAMLTTPDPDNRPLFTAELIKKFYLEECSNIFPVSTCHLWLYSDIKGLYDKFFAGPKYDGKYLHHLVRTKLQITKLTQTLTNVVIPTFDVRSFQPVIFSSYQVKTTPSMDGYLADICISTSAAPTYLPSHVFDVEDPSGLVREFNLVDGGVTANNPTMVAISEVMKEGNNGNESFHEMKPTEYDRFLVVSLGTGCRKRESRYNGYDTAKWGVANWLTKGGTPILDMFMEGSADMVDYHLATIFQGLQIEHNYIRIQEDSLAGDLAQMDLSTPENLNNLVGIGEALLNKPVSRINMVSGLCEPILFNGKTQTNKEALTRIAERLVTEKQLRLANCYGG